MCDAREEKELFPKQKKVFENVRHRAFPYIERTHTKKFNESNIYRLTFDGKWYFFLN